MKLWQHHAQQLPVTLRPLRRETLFSYTCRLSAANELDRPTILLRALGHPHGNLTQTALHDYDIALNAPALARLETFTGIPAQRLRKALPALHRRVDLPGDIPRTKLFRCWGLRGPCEGCASRVPGRPTILAYPQDYPAICTRHRRWLDGDKPRSQIDLTPAPEMMTAHRRYTRLHARITLDSDSREWLRRQLLTASSIVQGWVGPSRRNNPRLHQTWAARTAALCPWLTVVVPSDLLVFPEAVALAEILTDLRWRRHVAMVPHDIDLKPFFHRVAARLDQPPLFAATTRCLPPDPLRHWVQTHRRHHEQTRTEFWQRFRQTGQHEQPFPEIRHFK
jgi:TniQ